MAFLPWSFSFSWGHVSRGGQFVRVKMLPFDNKSEFQVVVDMPEGHPGGDRRPDPGDRGSRRQGARGYGLPNVRGRRFPYNFNGLVRHYFLRRGPHVADLQVNLVPKGRGRRRATTSPSASVPDRAFGRKYKAGSRWPRCRRAAGPANAGGRGLRPGLSPPDRSGPADPGPLSETDGSWMWIVHGGRPGPVPVCGDKEKAALNGVTAEQIAMTFAWPFGNGSRPSPSGEGKGRCSILLRLSREERSRWKTSRPFGSWEPGETSLPWGNRPGGEGAGGEVHYHKNSCRWFM